MTTVVYNSEERLTLEIIKQKAAEEEIEVAIDEDINGKKIIKVIKEDREWYLNSIYGQELAECWCSQYDVKEYGTIIALLGIANFEYIEKIKEKNEDIIIILYEPSYSIFSAAIECIGVEYLEKNDNVFLCCGKDGLPKMHDALKTIVGYEKIKKVRMMISPNYELIMKEECEQFKETYCKFYENVMLDRNTIYRTRDEIIQNVISNIPDYIYQYGLKDLKEAFEGINLENIPAIIVAAGPSLDKNIKELKNAKGKAFIIAVDTALKSLAKENIIPDISVTVDPHKPISLFDNDKIRNVPLIFSLGANANIKHVHKGMRIYQNSDHSILDKFEKRKEALSTGGSVANSAFSLAQVLGFKTVIFVGQDLAYPNNKMHTDDAYGRNNDNYINIDSNQYFEVEDIYGNMVKTEPNMNFYRNWFERAVIKYHDIKFIDATEGGAKKKGMEILTLKEALQRECKCSKTVNFSKIIGTVKPYFTDEEKEKIIEYINNIENEMSIIRKRMEEGIAAYNKLDEFNRKQKYTGREFKKNMEKIADINNWITEDKETEYLQLYVADVDYEVREVLFDQKENEYENIKHMIENGKKLIKSMINATYQIEKDMKLVAENIKKYRGEQS